jgi:heme A synthase
MNSDVMADVIAINSETLHGPLCDRPAVPAPGRIRLTAGGLLSSCAVQVYLGALVGGLRAGYAYNTWPLN